MEDRSRIVGWRTRSRLSDEIGEESKSLPHSDTITASRVVVRRRTFPSINIAANVPPSRGSPDRSFACRIVCAERRELDRKRAKGYAESVRRLNGILPKVDTSVGPSFSGWDARVADVKWKPRAQYAFRARLCPGWCVGRRRPLSHCVIYCKPANETGSP